MNKLFNEIARVCAGLRGVFQQAGDDPAPPRGRALLRDGIRNKSTAFTSPERDAHGLRGLLPHRVSTQDEQAARVLGNLRRKATDLEKYTYLSALQDRNEHLFHYVARKNIREIMPLIYTPTVGQACRQFSHLFQASKGFYVTPDDRGKIRAMLDNWHQDDVRVVVVTDGQRILGLGDLGANGMGIPIGKLALYSICGGIDPRQALPVMFDAGTDNAALRSDPLYLGYPHPRIRGGEYFALMDEFVAAIKDKFPKAIIQFEDFATDNAWRLLEEYRGKTACFNDDIQGTAAVALAGIYAAEKITGHGLKDERVMFLGAGSAATGIAALLVRALREQGLSEDEARGKIWLVDKDGLITANRKNPDALHRPYAHDHAPMDFTDAIHDIKPTVLIGATGAPGTFTKEAIGAMAAHNERPVILALSNPTSHAECTAREAYEASGGRALFISGSPFDPVEYDGKTFRPGQGNNAYIFPGVGLGAVTCEASRITEEMFLAAARAVADMVMPDDLAQGALYPPLENICAVSARIAKAVIETAGAQGLAGIAVPEDIEEFVARQMYDPGYPETKVKGTSKKSNPVPPPGF